MVLPIPEINIITKPQTPIKLELDRNSGEVAAPLPVVGLKTVPATVREQPVPSLIKATLPALASEHSPFRALPEIRALLHSAVPEIVTAKAVPDIKSWLPVTVAPIDRFQTTEMLFSEPTIVDQPNFPSWPNDSPDQSLDQILAVSEFLPEQPEVASETTLQIIEADTETDMTQFESDLFMVKSSEITNLVDAVVESAPVFEPAVLNEKVLSIIGELTPVAPEALQLAIITVNELRQEIQELLLLLGESPAELSLEAELVEAAPIEPAFIESPLFGRIIIDALEIDISQTNDAELLDMAPSHVNSELPDDTTALLLLELSKVRPLEQIDVIPFDHEISVMQSPALVELVGSEAGDDHEAVLIKITQIIGQLDLVCQELFEANANSVEVQVATKLLQLLLSPQELEALLSHELLPVTQRQTVYDRGTYESKPSDVSQGLLALVRSNGLRTINHLLGKYAVHTSIQSLQVAA